MKLHNYKHCKVCQKPHLNLYGKMGKNRLTLDPKVFEIFSCKNLYLDPKNCTQKLLKITRNCVFIKMNL